MGELQAGDPRAAGPYRLLGRLGSGGMGQVFLGRSATGALVAVKVIRPDLAQEPGFRTRFAREVRAAANVSGRFTALVLDADTESATPWLATAYVAGPSLAEAVTSLGPLPVPAVLTLGAGLAQGLRAIHAADVVHRDLKPTNVLLASDGPRVIDFGISRFGTASMLTAAGMVVGSPGFMSPEQAVGRAVGPASDVFSLGAVLAFAVTGTHPFGTGTAPVLMYRAVHDEPDLSLVPRALAPLVARCLAKDPGQRPGTAELLGWLVGTSGPAPRANRHRAPAHAAPVPVPAARAVSAARGPADRVPAGLAVAGAPAGLAPAGLALAGHAPALGAAPLRPAAAAPGDGAATLTAPALAALAPAVSAPSASAPVAPVSAALAPADGVPSGPDATTIGAAAVRPAGGHPRSAGGGLAARRSRRRLAWAGAVAGAVAAITAATVLPGTLGGDASAQPRLDVQAGPAPASSAVAPAPAPGASHRGARPGAAAPGSSPGRPSLAARMPARPASPSPARSASAGAAASPSGSPSPAPSTAVPAVPQIVSVTTYTLGVMVYVSLTYSDPGNDAAGVGLAGADGAAWPAESHPFAVPGLVSVGTWAFPFDLNCGTAGQYQSSVQAWIYDTSGDRSPAVVIPLACAG